MRRDTAMKNRVSNSRVFLSNVWRLAVPYWRSEQRWQARGLLAAIVALTLGLVFIAVWFNDW